MSGVAELRGNQGCARRYEDSVNVSTYDRTMDVSYWMRPNVPQCTSKGVNVTCSFYGPKDVPRTTKESFLQGRGQQLNSKCPDGDVIYLPKGVFELGARNQQDAKCQTTDLDPYFDRQPKSCFNISETDATAYTMGIPSAWQGTNVSMMDFHQGIDWSDREMGRMKYSHTTAKTSATQRGSYGNYNAF